MNIMSGDREVSSLGNASSRTGGDLFVSTERLGCDSPVMWPDQNFFGDFNPLHLSPSHPKWLRDVQKDDIRMINEFGSLPHSQLMEKVRALQNLAYKLGVDEAKEMSRGKCLNVFQATSNSPSNGSWKQSKLDRL